jgi:hypothetical protein
LEEDTTVYAYKAEFTSRWLSPDPLAEKYPELSPYIYCVNNPLKFIEYSAGIEYIKTLNTADFNKEYQKNMYLKSFEAMLCEEQRDTVKRNNLYMEIIIEIQSYLSKTANQETLVDLCLITSKIETKSEILKEIELLKTTGKYDNDFLNALVEKQNDSTVENVAIPVNE